MCEMCEAHGGRTQPLQVSEEYSDHKRQYRECSIEDGWVKYLVQWGAR